MRETRLKHGVSKLILFSELLTISLIIIYYFPGGFTESELSILLAIILPMSLLYITAIIKFARESGYLRAGRKIESIYASTAFYLLLLFFFARILIISLDVFNVIESRKLVVLLTIIHCGFGIYGGYFVTDLFSKRDSQG